MRVAVVGGTGSFGLALAKRLADAGYDVVIGSRDAERAAAAAAEIGVEGATNADACRGADLVVLATKADAAARRPPRELRQAIGTTPVLSVAAELTFTPAGVLPDAGGDVDRRAGPGRSSTAPVVAGLHSLAAREPRAARRRRGGRARLRRRRRREGDRARARRAHHRRAARSTAARSRAPARSRG